ncbi:putative membrane protein/domain [Spongiibacter sp. IMCC21906]|jgi:uncharacterized RDD family membrane protein YckC|uniref:RDD family protein n=1 Tax=Spongiibacter sp. IMCC21906 TaxID=1620392 RepID=UPI00062DFD5D|nr:putative membrane protein/domain [Spongiibacter sp. IMCC21906]
MAEPTSTATSTPATDHPNAGVIRRLMAMVYDGFLLFAVLFIAGAIPTLILSPEHIKDSPQTGTVVHELSSGAGGWLYQLYLLSIIVMFNSIFWRKQGQTLGMQAWRLKLVSLNGDKPSWGQCIIRVFASFLSLLPCGLGYLWLVVDKQQLAWHDRLSKTKVLLLPKR